jgi:hypothetical protein
MAGKRWSTAGRLANDHTPNLAERNIKPADLERARALIKAQTWTFAKTMPQCPHWYSVRKRWANEEDFEWLVRIIRTYGFREPYGKLMYTAWIDQGFKYWTMGWPVEETTIINRKPVDEQGQEIKPNSRPGLKQLLLF